MKLNSRNKDFFAFHFFQNVIILFVFQSLLKIFYSHLLESVGPERLCFFHGCSSYGTGLGVS